MRLTATRDGAAIEPGSIQSVGRDGSVLVAVSDVPSAWLDRDLDVRQEGDSKPRRVLRPPRSVKLGLPKPRFWKPLPVCFELREKDTDSEPLATLSFQVVTPLNPKLASVAAVFLLLVGAYLSLAFPDVVTVLEGFGGVGLGSITLSALVIPRLRTWIFAKLHHPVFALPSVALALSAGVFVHHIGVVTVNRTAETIHCEEGRNLAPGQSHASCTPKDNGVCDLLGKEAAFCQPLREVPDLPLLVRYGLLQKKEYGCTMRCLRAEPPGHAGPQLDECPSETLDAWKNAGTCNPPFLKWKTTKPRNALRDLPFPDVNATTLAASCEPSLNGGVCALPDEFKAFTLRDFLPVDGDLRVGLRLTSEGPLREVSVASPVSGSPVVLPFAENAVWAQADVEIGGLQVGHSLLRPSPQRGFLPEDRECWLLRSDEHLQSLVLRTDTAIARFVATDSSAVSAIPMCWSGRLDDVEVYLDDNWSPRDGWRLDLPGTMRAKRVRIYRRDRGFWGVAKDEIGSTERKDGIFRIQLHRVEEGENMPKDSLRTLKVVGGAVRWESNLAEPEWFWSGSSGAAPKDWSSAKHANVTVACSDSNPPKCTSNNGPVACWYTLSGRPVSKRECDIVKLDESTKSQLRTNYVPPACRPLTFCRELEKEPETHHAAKKTNKL